MSFGRAATVAWAFFKRDMLERLSYRAAFLIRGAGAVFSLAALYFFSRFVDSVDSPLLRPYGGGYLSFGLTGMILLGLQHTIISAYPHRIRAAQLAGTLEAMLASPTPSWLVLLCSPLYEFAAAFLGAVVYFVAAGLLFDLRFDVASPAALLSLLPLAMIAFASVGFFGAALTMVLRRIDPLGLFVGGLSTLAGGVFFPTGVLPPWLHALGRALPITHALEIARRSMFTGARSAELGSALLGLALFCAVAAPLGIGAFVLAVRRSRRDGSLSHY